MLNRIFENLKTSSAGLVSAVLTIAMFFGFDFTMYQQIAVTILGIIGTLVGLFAKDK